MLISTTFMPIANSLLLNDTQPVIFADPKNHGRVPWTFKSLPMAVKIRLARRGRKKLALFDVVIANSRSPRDGRFIEKIGTYNPNSNPATIVLNDDKAFQWLMNGAQPTDTVKAMLSYRGILLRKHLQIGVNKGAITQEAADEKFNTWKQSKEAKISGKVENLSQTKEEQRQTRLAAESKVREERAAAIARKKAPIVPEAPAAEAEPEADATVETTDTAPETQE